MASDSPPPSDACPELTPDNGTPTSSCSGSVSRNQITHQVEEDTANSQVHNNTLNTFENISHQVSSSDSNNVAENHDVPAREGSTPRAHHLGSPDPAPTCPPRPSLRGLATTETISTIDIGSPTIPLSLDSRHSPVVRFVGEPTMIHTSTPPPSRAPTITFPSENSSRGAGGRRWLNNLLPDFSAWLGRHSRGDVNGNEPRRTRWLSLGRFARWRKGGS